jgi:hypothetical protein
VELVYRCRDVRAAERLTVIKESVIRLDTCEGEACELVALALDRDAGSNE